MYFFFLSSCALIPTLRHKITSLFNLQVRHQPQPRKRQKKLPPGASEGEDTDEDSEDYDDSLYTGGRVVSGPPAGGVTQLSNRPFRLTMGLGGEAEGSSRGAFGGGMPGLGGYGARVANRINIPQSRL